MMLEMSHISKVPSPPSLPIYPSPATRGAPAPLTCAFSGYRQVAKTKSGEGLAAASPRTSPSPMPRLQPVMSTERQRGWAMLQPRFVQPWLGSWSLGSARAAPVPGASAQLVRPRFVQPLPGSVRCPPRSRSPRGSQPARGRSGPGPAPAAAPPPPGSGAGTAAREGGLAPSPSRSPLVPKPCS